MKNVLLAVALGALALPLLVASAWLHLDTPAGRVAFGDALSNGVSSAIRGEMRVEGVRKVSLPYVEVDRFVVRIADLEPLDLEGVHVNVDPWASLYHGGVVIRSARVDRGLVDVSMSPHENKPWIEWAFDSPGSGGGLPGWLAPPGDEMVRIEGVEYERIRFHFADGSTELNVRDTAGEARMWLPDGGEFQGRFWGISGRMETSIGVVPDSDVSGVALTVDPTGPSIVRFAGRAEAVGTDLTIAGHAPHRGGVPVRMCIWTGGEALSTLLGVGAEVVTDVGTDISLDVRPSEAPSDPSCEEEGDSA